MTLTETAGVPAVTSSITPFTGLEITYGGGSMSPSDIIVENSATYDCSIPITIDDIYDILPDKNVGGPYIFYLTETEKEIVTEEPIAILYKIVPKPITADDITVAGIPTQIYDGANDVQPTVSVCDNGTLLTASVDYTVSYGSNNMEGIDQGTVTIMGIGNYTDSRTIKFTIINEYFTEDGITYHATSSTTVSVGNEVPAAAIATNTSDPVVIPATVSHVVTTPFQVTGVDVGAFANCTVLTGLSLPNTITNIGNGAFTGCSALRYVNLSDATGFTPTSLERTVATAPFYGVPKQAFVYLNGTPIVGENYVYKVGDDDYRCYEFVIYDDISGSQTEFIEANGYQWAYNNLYEFTAKYVINTRKLKAEQHYTVFLPYDLSIPESFKAYHLIGANNNKDLIGFEEVTGLLIKFKPYVLIPSETGQLLSTTDVIVPVFSEDNYTSITKDGVTLTGTMKYISGNEVATNGYYIMQSGNTWKKITGGDYTDGSNKACILPMRAYLSDDGSAARQYFSATFTDAAGNTTTVDQLRLDEDLDGAVYDLQGRKVQTPMRKGIYVINGKKIVK